MAKLKDGTRRQSRSSAIGTTTRAGTASRATTRPTDVLRLRGSVDIEHTLAELGAERLWELLNDEPYVTALGALTGNQAVQQVRAGLKAIYSRGWQVAADANLAGQMYPDQSLYPSNTVPQVVKRINQALQRADQIEHVEGKNGTHWFAPIVADAEAGFGGPLNAFELMKAMIEAGAAGVHFEDQLASEKKCGHMGGKVLRPDAQFIRTLARGAPRRRRDGRADAAHRAHRRRQRARCSPATSTSATSRSSPASARPRASSASRAASRRPSRARLAYAPYADLVWCETSTPDLDEAREFAEGVHAKFPGKLLAYNCSPSFNWEEARRRQPSPGSSASSARWATSSSSSRWPASTR